MCVIAKGILALHHLEEAAGKLLLELHWWILYHTRGSQCHHPIVALCLEPHLFDVVQPQPPLV